MAIDKGYFQAMIKYFIMYMNSLDQSISYNMIDFFKNDSNSIYSVAIYYHFILDNYDQANELNLALSINNNVLTTKECIICYDTNIHIKLKCNHDGYFHCYTHIDI